jgi:UBX domain-containing protein 1
MPGTFAEGGSGSGSAGGSEGPELRRAIFEVDQTLPSTSVQIRLADGTRCVQLSWLVDLANDVCVAQDCVQDEPDPHRP